MPDPAPGFLKVPRGHATHCPFKGVAAHYSLAGGPRNIAWSYEQPDGEMSEIRGYVAFHPQRVDALGVSND